MKQSKLPMIGISRWLRAGALFAAALPWMMLLGSPAIGVAQPASGRIAQAKSQLEFDAYLEIVQEKAPQELTRRVDAFEAQFPQSELLGAAYQFQVDAFEKMNKFDAMLAAGRKALDRDPNSIDTLLKLAPAMASRAAGRRDRTQLLREAEEFAKRSLEILKTLHAPRTMPLERWRRKKRQIESEAHGVLGLVAFQRADLQNAVAEFRNAIDLALNPEGIQYLRLGLALSAMQEKDKARQSLRRAVEIGPEAVSQLARDELRKLGPSSN